jgi:hypothetical protein
MLGSIEWRSSDHATTNGTFLQIGGCTEAKLIVNGVNGTMKLITRFIYSGDIGVARESFCKLCTRRFVWE